MLKPYTVILKKVGETPLQALEAFRGKEHIAAEVPLTYAGRLDTMAEGKLIVLSGDECKKKEVYNGLDKEYIFEILLGFTSDSQDVLGIVEEVKKEESFSEKEIRKATRSFLGKNTFPYPAFSAKKVDGKQMFEHAKEGTLSDIEIPTKESVIYSLGYSGKQVRSLQSVINEALAKIDASQGGDFRKEEIRAHWEKLRTLEKKYVMIFKFKTIVSSGTYIRTLAPLIAQALGVGGLVYSLSRTKIGRYVPLGTFGFWRKNF